MQKKYPPPGPLPEKGRGNEHLLSLGAKPLLVFREGLGWVPDAGLGSGPIWMKN